jgi:hypothetical protein
LRSLIGPANHYHVRILDTRDAELVLGSIRRLEIKAENVLAGGEFRVDRLHVEASGLRFRGGPDDLVFVRQSQVSVEASEAALNDYVQRTRPDENASVRLNDGSVTLFGSVRLLGITAPVETTGRLEIEEGRRVVFRADQVAAPALRLPDDGTAFIERQVNPLLNLERLDLPVRLTAIRLGTGRITLEGVLDLPAARPQHR